MRNRQLRSATFSAMVACLITTSANAQARPERHAVTANVTSQIKFPSQKKNRIPSSFELINRVMVFRAVVHGESVWAIFDNRLEDSLIDVNFARKADIELGNPIAPMQTPTGSLARRRSESVRVEIPGQVTVDAPLSAVDLAFLAKATGRPISLALGKEYFEDLVFLIKPSNHSFQVGPSGSLTGSAALNAIILNDGRPTLSVTVNGIPCLVTLDLGYNGTLALSGDAWLRTGMNKASSTTRQAAHLEGDVFSVMHARARSVQFGSASFSDADISQQTVLPSDGDGLIGLGVLSLFDFALDIKARKLWLLSKAN